jgi:RNA polymerase sigma-70 factor (ECF subfamily)
VFDDLPFKEVAELADCTENTAKVNFHYAVKRLRELLGDER